MLQERAPEARQSAAKSGRTPTNAVFFNRRAAEALRNALSIAVQPPFVAEPVIGRFAATPGQRIANTW